MRNNKGVTSKQLWANMREFTWSKTVVLEKARKAISFRRRSGQRQGLRGRSLRIELLEDRTVLAAPELLPIGDQVLFAGAPLYVALNAFDADGDSLSFSAAVVDSHLSHPEIDTPTLLPVIDHDNRNLRLRVTRFGDMVFELFERWAPRTTARIIDLAARGFYDGTTFHRVIQHFVIQGGDPTGTGAGGSGVRFDDEFHPYLMHTGKGVLSMAKSTDDTNDSQFFVTAADTRHLDFNHNVFGFLVRGESVRQQIAAVPVDTNSRPLEPVVIEKAEIFYDTQNRVLTLLAPRGTTGWADVKVTVTDPQGNQVEQIFRVTVQQDPYNSNAYLLPIAPIWTRAGLPITVAIGAYDREGNSLVFAASPGTGVTDLSVQIDRTTGLLTVTPHPEAVGVRSVIVGVSDPQAWTSDPWDTQVVPVYIRPGTPALTLLPESDTGFSDSDGITRLNNTPGNTLRFQISGLVVGSEFYVMIDDVVVATGRATATVVIAESTGEFRLSDGRHKITAGQVLRDQAVQVGNYRDTVTLWSDDSSPVWITVDTVPPMITSQPPTRGAEGRLYEYIVQVIEEITGPIRFELVQGPEGMSIDPVSGRVSWIPQHGQGGLHQVLIRAVDTAGNFSDQAFAVQVARAPRFDIASSHVLTELQPWQLVIAISTENPPAVVQALDPLPWGMVFDSAEPALRWIPNEEQGPGEYTVRLQAIDSLGLTTTFSLTLTVLEDNQPPQLAAIDEIFAREGEVIRMQLSATDPDLPVQPLLFSLHGEIPPGMSLDPHTGILEWQPQEEHGPRVYRLEVRVTDSYGAFSSKPLVITVLEDYQPPRFEAPPSLQAVVGSVLEFRVQATDPDIPARPIRYRIVEAPARTILDEESGNVHLELTREQWLAMGGPSDLTFVVEAYKYVEELAREFSARQTIRLPVVDPWALAATSFAEDFDLAGENPVNSQAPQVLPIEVEARVVSVPARGMSRGLDFQPPADSRSIFAGLTGWLSRPTGALGVSDRVLDILDLIEQEFLRGRVPEEVLNILGENTGKAENSGEVELRRLSISPPAGTSSSNLPPSGEELPSEPVQGEPEAVEVDHS
jgi:cyclophilin family peptidyl-prolyl cis-trans isomerase